MSRRAPPRGRASRLSGIQFVLGKGGVGKTAVAEGLARAVATLGERVLLVRLGETARASPFGSGLRSIRQGLQAIDLDARAAMDEYVHNVVRLRPLVRLITANEIYRRFFAAAPGLPELVSLGRIRAYAKETVHGEPRWTCLVVDAPSSGHGALMLETPFAALRAVPVGPFARIAHDVASWIESEARLNFVAVPEEMAVLEAIELARELRERVGVRPERTFLNRVRGDSLSAAVRAALRTAGSQHSPEDLRLIECAARVSRRARLEAFHERRLLGALHLRAITIPDTGAPLQPAIAEVILEAIA